MVYHQLGMVAQDRGRLGEAEGWYKKSLAISEALDQPGMATTQALLGTLKGTQSDRQSRPSLWAKVRRAFT